jgi:hypothetical protein
MASNVDTVYSSFGMVDFGTSAATSLVPGIKAGKLVMIKFTDASGNPTVQWYKVKEVGTGATAAQVTLSALTSSAAGLVLPGGFNDAGFLAAIVAGEVYIGNNFKQGEVSERQDLRIPIGHGCVRSCSL